MTQVDGWPITALIPESDRAPILIDDKHAALSIAVVDRGSASLLDTRWEKAGVYCLLDPVTQDATFGAYVGQATALRGRLMSHEIGKLSWVRALLIRRDTTYGFTSADIGWLEGALWSMAESSERGITANKVKPMDNTLPPYERAVLDTFMFPIRRVLRLIGYSFEPPGESIPTSSKTRTNYNVTVVDLLRAGLIGAGDPVAFTYPGLSASGTLMADGRLEVDGQVYETLSGAAQRLRGGPTNGWAYWAVIGPTGTPGQSLADLRQKLLATNQDKPAAGAQS
jgi:hypothetical protein